MTEFTDLILLVGTNPLPNYVVARYFLDNNDKLQRIWLIHSEENTALEQSGTLQFAENIRDTLHDDPERFRFVALYDVTSAQQIAKDLSEKMYGAVGRDAVLHLNYTGGTKAMAVHVYQKLKQQFKERISFSYLDARSFRLKEDEQLESLSGDLREEICISMEDLFKLHGYKRQPESETDEEVDYSGTIQKIEELIDQENLDVLLKWQKDFARKVFYDDKGLIKQPKRFWKNLQLLSTDNQIDISKVDMVKEKFRDVTPPEVIEVIKSLPYPNIMDEKGELWIPALNITNPEFNRRIARPLDFLDGKWLEQYVFEVLDEAIRQDPLLRVDYTRGRINLEHNWKIERKDTKEKEFEVDVMLLYGYQLCGISCTTSQKEGECKPKGFEIIHRMKQIGGDEARMVLVTCLPDEKKAEFWHDLLTTTGSKRKNLLVLTKGDLKRQSLWNKIRQHLWGD